MLVEDLGCRVWRAAVQGLTEATRKGPGTVTDSCASDSLWFPEAWVPMDVLRPDVWPLGR